MIIIKNDSFYINKIIDDCNVIILELLEIDYDKFLNNTMLQDSICFRLIQISENSNKITDYLKNKNQSIPWILIKGLRNKIVHDYTGIDLYIVFETAKRDIPQLLNKLKNVTL